MLLQFFTILAGTKDNGVLRKWYWLQVDTSGFSGASPITDYTLWGYCYRDGDSLSNAGDSTGCAPHKAAYGFEPDQQFSGDEVPQWFVDNHHKEYYLTRLLFPFFLIALVFETPVLFLSLFSIAKRRFGIVNSLLTFISFLFQAAASAMATVAYVQARNHFKDDGHDAKIGSSLQGFIWASVFMLAFNTIVFCCIRPHHAAHKSSKSEETAFAPPAANEPGPDIADTNGGRFFGFRNSTKGATTADDSSFVRAR